MTGVDSIQRREFMTLIAGAATLPVSGWPSAARAQQGGRVRRISVLMGLGENDGTAQLSIRAFTKGLQDLGWVEGRNIQIDYRWGTGDVARIRAFAKESVNLIPDVIVAHTTPVTAAVQRETKTIPIIFVVVSDPVGSGFVASLPRPGGNITGFINIEGSLAGKWVELLKEVKPSVKRVVFLYNPDTATYADYYLGPFEAAARSLAVEPIPAQVRNAADIATAVATLADRQDGGLLVMPDTFTALQRVYDQIIALTGRYRMPAIYPYRFMAAAGGLLSYGVDTSDLFRRATSYVDRILKGEKTADLPVQLPTKFEFVLNLKTAKALGIEFPLKLHAFADEVIE
jgi:putative ABC transport system substrate-binding protein